MTCFAIMTGFGSARFLTTDDALTDTANDPTIRIFDSHADGLEWIASRNQGSRVLYAMGPIVCPLNR
jgi:hypothetical protein